MERKPGQGISLVAIGSPTVMSWTAMAMTVSFRSLCCFCLTVSKRRGLATHRSATGEQ